MTTHLDMLKRLGACSDAIEYCATHPDLRQAWKACGRGDWLLWLLVRLDRRRGIGVTVEVVRATCAHLAPDEVTTDVLNPLAAWAAGDDSVDVKAVQARAWELYRSAPAYAANAWRSAAAYAANACAAAVAAAVAAVTAAVPTVAAAVAAEATAVAPVANRVDRIRALGNGQVPAVVAGAWEVLHDD